MGPDPAPQKVTLHLYDLSQGMARAMSAQLLGKQLDGIWHTGIVCFGQVASIHTCTYSLD